MTSVKSGTGGFLSHNNQQIRIAVPDVIIGSVISYFSVFNDHYIVRQSESGRMVDDIKDRGIRK